MAKKFELIMPGVYLVGRSERNPGIVYFRRMFNGRRVIRKASLQGALATDLRGRPTKALKQEAANWTASLMNKAYIEKREGLREMTFEDLAREYPKAAALERVKSGKPSERTVENTLKGMAKFIEAAGMSMQDRCAKMTTDMFDITITMLIKEGKTKATAWSYAAALQVAAARWSGAYYRRAGFQQPAFMLPAKRNMRPARYVRPTKEQLDAVVAWYDGLWNDADKRKWLAATMMLQFAMRNGDAERATPDVFKERQIRTKTGEVVERMVLQYTPHKTAASSARSVAWPVAPKIWERIKQARMEIAQLGEACATEGTGSRYKGADARDKDGIKQAEEAQDGKRKGGPGWWKTKGAEQMGKLIPFGHMTYKRINEELRRIFPDTQKASYELRKICVDHVYQSLGPEKASAISGDDLKTVTYYYADPSQAVDEDGVDIAELL